MFSCVPLFTRLQLLRPVQDQTDTMHKNTSPLLSVCRFVFFSLCITQKVYIGPGSHFYIRWGGLSVAQSSSKIVCIQTRGRILQQNFAKVTLDPS